jgi:copper chaperone CopZ
VIIKIDGMSCGHCEGRVKAELEKLGASVESVSAEKKNAIVSGIDETGAKNAVTAAGYKVVAFN